MATGSSLNYLLYNDETKEITNNICIPQGKICDTETFCSIDPTSTFTIVLEFIV